jgi:hypothetical protein
VCYIKSDPLVVAPDRAYSVAFLVCELSEWVLCLSPWDLDIYALVHRARSVIMESLMTIMMNGMAQNPGRSILQR